jgi:chemotaxis protein CheC
VSAPQLSEEHRDALQEVANIAMGEAGASLAQLLGTFVRLSVPRIQISGAASLPDLLGKLLGSGQRVTAVRQSFLSRVQGEAIVLFGEAGCAEVADLMGYESSLAAGERREVLLDVANMLVGACLGGIFRQFHIDPGFSAPSLLAENTPCEELLDARTLNWSHALMVEVHFGLETSTFSCHLVLLLPERSIDAIRDALAQLIADL